MSKEHRLIDPFVDHQVGQGVISYGLSAYGYDIRVSNEFKIFTNVHTTIVDPKNFDERSFVDYKGEVCVIPPNSFALSNTIENFRIPRNVYGICIGKSTYARCGIIINVTGFDAEWEGNATLEISNTTPLPCRIYAGEGIAQVLFFESDEDCEVSYRDKKGKYQGQERITAHDPRPGLRFRHVAACGQAAQFSRFARRSIPAEPLRFAPFCGASVEIHRVFLPHAPCQPGASPPPGAGQARRSPGFHYRLLAATWS